MSVPHLSQLDSTIVYRGVRELDKERTSHEVRRELPPDLIYSRQVDLSDLPSQYTEDIETSSQVLDINDEEQQQEAR